MSYRLTLAEAEAGLRKAARACGLDWGLAEEAGKAARWLAAFALPGPELMLEHLLTLRGREYGRYRPEVTFEPWQAPGGVLCPIVTGAALADRAGNLLDGEPVRLGPTAYPLLIAAMLGQAARFYDTAFVTCWDDVRVDCFGHDLRILGKREALLTPQTGAVCCCHDDEAEPELHASTLAYEIDEETLRRIDELAFETYAPATEASRAGAGAGLVDND